MNFKRYHVSRNLWDFERWLTDRGATYTKDGDSYTFASQQVMYSTPFYFSQTDVTVSISGLIEAVTATNPRVHLLKADGTRATTDALTTAVSKRENVSCAGLIFDWSTPGNIKVSLPMLNEGSTALPYEPYSSEVWHDIPHYIHNTSTDTLTTLPAIIYPNDTSVTVEITGNTGGVGDLVESGEHAGEYIIPIINNGVAINVYNATALDVSETLSTTIPTTDGANTLSVYTQVQPSEVSVHFKGWHPVSAVHEKSKNLFDYQTMALSRSRYALMADGSESPNTQWSISDYIPINGSNFVLSKVGGNSFAICFYNANKQYVYGQAYATGGATSKQSIICNVGTDVQYARFSYVSDASGTAYDNIANIMLNAGSTALPYEPYWT